MAIFQPMIRKACLIALTLCSIPCLAFAQTFGAEEFTLKNGLQVVVIPNHRAPVVTHMLWMKVGGADNAPGQSGMAHYFEHLMFKGTKTMAPGDFSKTVKILGGDDNAFTSQDYTAYFESIAVDNLPKVMAMEADRLANLAPPEDHYKSEKSVVLEERRQRTDNDPKAIFAEQMNSALFVNHPYNTPVVGWLDEIEKYQWQDVKSYYDAWYAPNNAILVVSGDITAAQLKPLAEKYYGPLAKKNLPKRLRPQIPPSHGDTLLTLHHETIHQPMMEKIYIAPTETKARQESLALQVLSDILDGGAATRFYKHLVVDQKKAIDVSFRYNANMLDYGTITIDAVPVEGVSLLELEALVEKEIDDIMTKGVTAQEVAESVQRLRDEAIFARDSVAGPAMIFGSSLTTGSSIADVENWPADIAKVTPEQVKAAAQKYLNTDKPWIRKPVTGYLLPEEKLEEPATESAPTPKKKEGGANVQR